MCVSLILRYIHALLVYMWHWFMRFEAGLQAFASLPSGFLYKDIGRADLAPTV